MSLVKLSICEGLSEMGTLFVNKEIAFLVHSQQSWGRGCIKTRRRFLIRENFIMRKNPAHGKFTEKLAQLS